MTVCNNTIVAGGLLRTCDRQTDHHGNHSEAHAIPGGKTLRTAWPKLPLDGYLAVTPAP